MSVHRPVDLDRFPAAEMPPLPPMGAPGEPVASVAPAPRRPVEIEIAALDFLDPAALSVQVPLSFPFRLDGREIREIVIRRLAAGEVARIIDHLSPDDRFTLYDFLTAMTGLPKAVLRGLEDGDNWRVMDAARPFWPRLVTEVFASQISGPGAATSS